MHGRVATALLKTPRTQLKKGKNDTVLIPVLNTTFPHLEHRSNKMEYSFYKCIRWRNAKTRQSICSKLSVRMSIVLPMQKYSIAVLCCQWKNKNKI